MSQYQEELIDVPGFKIGIKRWGHKSRRPVLAFHGMLDNAASYDLLAPLLPELCIIAVDSPGAGYSSHYPDGILPHWLNDSFLMLHLVDALGLKDFDVIGHSLGSIFAVVLAALKPESIGKVVLLDCFGPLTVFQENSSVYLHEAANLFLNHSRVERKVLPDLETAIQERMKQGVSYQAARALVERGTRSVPGGLSWTFDQRLRCGKVTFPFEDRVRALFAMVKQPVCVVRAGNGLRYPDHVLKERMAAFSDLTTYEVSGGHHVHMDDPGTVAKVVKAFLLRDTNGP